jgi:hypothetical protein
MNRSKLKTFAPQARRDFIRAMTDRAALYGLTKDKIDPVTLQGDVALIGGKAFPASVTAKRERLEDRVKRNGFEQTMEAMAYTWFNRLVAIRYMELHGYLDHGYRVLSHPEGKPTPEIVEQAEHVDLPGLDRDEVISLKLDGTKETELYRSLLIAQCNAMHAAMPFLFERIADETELLLPDSLLHSDSLVRKLVTDIDEADWQAVEIIGWLYQFYISEKKDEVIGKVVKSEDIPAATQLFTPNWIVKYLVQNSLGRQWLATYPDSPLKAKMEFYIEPAEQTPEMQAQLKAITPDSLNPEELTFLDPACGSGHILVDAYSLLRDIYLERGYRLRDIPKLILTKNLFGLEIDDRAAQLAAFALLMMARADDRNILSSGVTLNVLAIQQTDHLDTEALLQAFSHMKLPAKPQPTSGEFGFMDEVRSPLYANTPALTPAADPLVANLRQLLDFFKGAKTFGSLLQVPRVLVAKLPALEERIEALQQDADLTTASLGILDHFVRQAHVLSRRYSFVAANPPYMGSKYYTTALKTFVNREYASAKADLYACFMERNRVFTMPGGFHAMINIPNWMFLSSFEDLRVGIFAQQTIDTFLHNGRGVFGSDFGSCAFVIRHAHLPEYRGSYRRLFERQGSVASNAELTDRFYTAKTSTPSNGDFAKIPGSPVAYWMSPRVCSLFESFPLLRQLAAPRKGNSTSDNGRFVRHWHEVMRFKVGIRLKGFTGTCRWIPYNKGGGCLRWYGLNSSVVDWKDNGAAIRAIPTAVVTNEQFYLQPGLTWSTVTIGRFSIRYFEDGFIFDNGGCCVFSEDRLRMYLLGLMNSAVFTYVVESINPTVNFQSGEIGKFPVNIVASLAATIEASVTECVELAKFDWDSFETSWDFEALPAISHKLKTLRESQAVTDAEYRTRLGRLKELEESNNRHFIFAYGLESELLPDVRDDQLTLYRPDRAEDMRRLVSFAIGCAMGRYSLDKPGLIYANSGNEGFDTAAYVTFPADKDGIIPVTEGHWFADDAATRFEGFVSKAWPAEHLDENLAFVAEGLGVKANESPRQTIRRYLSDGFYKHHLQTYKRRPIYWLFTSGKQRAFQALVYLHRYNEGTLSRMRTEYVIPLQGKIAGRIEKLEGDKAKATSTSHGKAIQKEQDKLRKQQTELVAFDEKLRHYADLRIKLDLDDGVKVNYRKFADPAIGEIVAEVKAVCGKDEDE